jgi:molybdopterin molybdotransferase
MIALEEAQRRLLQLAAPLSEELVDVGSAVGRYLAKEVRAKRTQPGKNLSAMDGYAFAHGDSPGPWRVVGESAAGAAFGGGIAEGEAVRIFTGAPVPPGADTVLIQENAVREGDILSVRPETKLTQGQNVRLAGSDFTLGMPLIEAATCLNPAHIALACMAGYSQLIVHRKPRIAIFQTGDELVEIGKEIGEDQIPASNGPMLTAMLSQLPCCIVENKIIPDDLAQIQTAFETVDADIIVTIGGASVGDHDLIKPALEAAGASLDFWKVAMRPGKPVIAGKLRGSVVLGLPGNPVSAYVTAFLLLFPLIRHLAGSAAPLPKLKSAKIDTRLAANGDRAYFIRAVVDDGRISILPSADSAILRSLSQANALIYRAAFAPECASGERVNYFAID